MQARHVQTQSVSVTNSQLFNKFHNTNWTVMAPKAEKKQLCMWQVHGVNCFTARWNWQGIAATADTRAPRDVAGQRLKIRFEIVDRRFGVLAGPVKEGEVDPNRVQRGPYTVYLTLQVM